MSELASKYKTVSIVGMAKNAGKTTALNFLIEEAMDEGLLLGVTSTGRDGESTDLVTATDKPKVYLDEGTIVSVPVQLFDLAEGGLEIVRRTRFGSSIGDILLCRVMEAGYVQIAGPVATMDTKKMYEEMFELGCELVMIDGAIDRKSIASPETSDAVILSTGAVISRTMKKVVEETAYIVGLYTTDVLNDDKARQLIEEDGDKDIVMLIDEQDGELKLRMLDHLTTGLGNSKKINEAISENTKYVYIPGAFSDSVIDDISLKNLKQVEFILKDPTRVFIKSIKWGQLRKKGFTVSVLQNIKVAAVTVNPTSPQGYSFEHEALRDAMQKAIPDIPVIDVRL